MYWRDIHVRRVDLVSHASFVHVVSLVQPNKRRRPDQPGKANEEDRHAWETGGFFSFLLEDRTALGLRGKPFSLHLLNKRGAVHIEQLSRLARNPVGLSKRANDEAILKLLELSWQIHPLIAEGDEMRFGLIDGYRTTLEAFGKIGHFDRSRSTQHHKTLDHVLQFPNISRPVMFHEVGHRVRRTACRGSPLATSHSPQEMIH